jgi:hypothetical protein
MPWRTYKEKNRTSVEHSIEDEKALERFICQLGGVEEALKARKLLKSSNSIEATASYQLEHPYEAENFWKYSLPRNETVST